MILHPKQGTADGAPSAYDRVPYAWRHGPCVAYGLCALPVPYAWRHGACVAYGLCALVRLDTCISSCCFCINFWDTCLWIWFFGSKQKKTFFYQIEKKLREFLFKSSRLQTGTQTSWWHARKKIICWLGSWSNIIIVPPISSKCFWDMCSKPSAVMHTCLMQLSFSRSFLTRKSLVTTNTIFGYAWWRWQTRSS